METGGLLLWAFLTDTVRELKFVSMENSLATMRDMSKRKTGLRESTIQLKELVESK
jgi:hypothetical protein